MKMKVLVIQLCLITLCDPMDCSPLGSSVQGILPARILEWVAISFSSGSSQPRDQTCISWSPALAGRYFTIWATWETLHAFLLNPISTIQLSFKVTSWNQSVLWSVSSFLRTLVSSQCSTLLVFLWPPWPPFFMSSQSLPGQVFLRVISCTFWPHPSTPALYAFFLGNIISYQAFVYWWFLNWICNPVFLWELYTFSFPWIRHCCIRHFHLSVSKGNQIHHTQNGTDYFFSKLSSACLISANDFTLHADAQVRNLTLFCMFSHSANYQINSVFSLQSIPSFLSSLHLPLSSFILFLSRLLFIELFLLIHLNTIEGYFL